MPELKLISILDAHISKYGLCHPEQVLRKSAHILKDSPYSQTDLAQLIDSRLDSGDLFLDTDGMIGRTNLYNAINIYKLQRTMWELDKQALVPDLVHAIRFAMEVIYLVNKLVLPLVDGMKQDMTTRSEEAPSGAIWEGPRIRDDALSLHIKSLMFVNRAFVDKMLLILNQLQFILGSGGGQQPSTDLKKLFRQFCQDRLKLEQELHTYLHKYLQLIVDSRFMRNNLKLGARFVFIPCYHKGEVYVKAEFEIIKRQDRLMDQLAEHLNRPSDARPATATLPRFVTEQAVMMKGFLDVLCGILDQKVGLTDKSRYLVAKTKVYPK